MRVKCDLEKINFTQGEGNDCMDLKGDVRMEPISHLAVNYYGTLVAKRKVNFYHVCI